MNQIELLRHVADNLEAGRAAGIGLLFNECSLVSTSISNIWWGKSNLYTLAPRTHEVNGFTVPAPIDVEPDYGIIYYVLRLDADDLSYPKSWEGDTFDKRSFNRGLCFSTRKAAQQNAITMTGRDLALGVEGV